MRGGTVADTVSNDMRSAIVPSAMLAILVSACAARAPATSNPVGDRNLLTQADLREHHFTTAYDAVQALRPIWLQARGATSLLGAQVQVVVYLNDTRLGGIETLREVSIEAVVTIRHLDGLAATARWGLDHGEGAILVSTF
jgi:hypothetical protein